MFYRLVRLTELYDGLRLPVKLGREELLLIHEQGQSWIIQRRCPHGEQALDRGTVVDGRLRCPGHGMVFSLQSGRCDSNSYCLRRYPLAYDGPWLGVDL